MQISKFVIGNPVNKLRGSSHEYRSFKLETNALTKHLHLKYLFENFGNL
jgi:hypothetical protein